MTIFILIIVNLLILNVWLRISKTIFSQNDISKKTRWALLFWSIIAALLFFYPHIAWMYESNTALFLTYCFWWFIAVSLMVKQSLSVRSVLSFIIFWILLRAIATVSPLLWVWTGILYYLLVAWSEELMKFFSSKPFTTFSLLDSDIILRSILLALWFSFLENILYTIPALDSFIEASTILINRGATGYLMHSVFTGSIAYISRKFSKNTLIQRSTLWALALWTTLHLTYNIIVSQHIVWLTFLAIILAYWLLSYLFYTSESVYLREI